MSCGRARVRKKGGKMVKGNAQACRLRHSSSSARCSSGTFARVLAAWICRKTFTAKLQQKKRGKIPAGHIDLSQNVTRKLGALDHLCCFTVCHILQLGVRWCGRWEFRVWGLGFGVWGLGFGVWGLGFTRLWTLGWPRVEQQPQRDGIGALRLRAHLDDGWLSSMHASLAIIHIKHIQNPTKPTTNHNSQPTTHNPQPTTHNSQPTTHNPQPTTHNPQPTTCIS